MNKREKTALILNILIFIFTVVGCILCFGEILIVQAPLLDHGIRVLKFFTVQSNILGGILALVYIIYFIIHKKTGKNIPTAVKVLKLMATIDLVITFLVVALFLGFIVEEGYFSLYLNANFLFHLVIPVLNFISFTFFEDTQNLQFKHTFIGLIHLIAYSIFYLTIVLTHWQNGAVDIAYDWYAFAQLGLPMAFVIDIILFALGYLVAFLLYKATKVRNAKN